MEEREMGAAYDSAGEDKESRRIEKGKEKKAHVKVMGDNLLQTKIDGVNLVPTFSIEQTNTYLDVYGFPPVE